MISTLLQWEIPAHPDPKIMGKSGLINNYSLSLVGSFWHWSQVFSLDLPLY